MQSHGVILYLRFESCHPVLSSSCITCVTLVMGEGSSVFIALSILVVFSWRHFWGWGFDNSNLDGYEVVACGFGLHFFF